MNILLSVLQVFAALLYGASGVMKVFLFDQVSKDVRSFAALPRSAWRALGILKLVCTAGLIIPAIRLIIIAGTLLAGFHECFGEGATLSITQSNQNVVLTWPRTGGRWVLVETPGLDYYYSSNGVTYKEAFRRTIIPSSSYQTNGTNIFAVLPVSSTNMFFMLQTNNFPPPAVPAMKQPARAVVPPLRHGVTTASGFAPASVRPGPPALARLEGRCRSGSDVGR